MGDEELRLLVPAWPSGGRENFPGKANPGSAPDIDRSATGLEGKNADKNGATAETAVAHCAFRGSETTG